MSNNDGYGSAHREAMKRSMERPAGEWKPTNRLEKDRPDLYMFTIIAVILGIACFLAWLPIVHTLWVRLGR